MLEGEINAVFGVVGTYCTCNNCDTVGLAFGSCWRHFRITSIRTGGARSQPWRSSLFVVVGNEIFGFGLVIAFTFAHWERMWWKGVYPYTKLYKIHPKDHTSDLKLICWKGKTKISDPLSYIRTLILNHKLLIQFCIQVNSNFDLILILHMSSHFLEMYVFLINHKEKYFELFILSYLVFNIVCRRIRVSTNVH